MLSAAKHLLFLIGNKQKKILRSAQNDTAYEFFSSLLNPALHQPGSLKPFSAARRYGLTGRPACFQALKPS